MARMIYQPSLKDLTTNRIDSSKFTPQVLIDLVTYEEEIRNIFIRGDNEDDEDEEDEDLEKFAGKDEKDKKAKKKEEEAMWLA